MNEMIVTGCGQVNYFGDYSTKVEKDLRGLLLFMQHPDQTSEFLPDNGQDESRKVDFLDQRTEGWGVRTNGTRCLPYKRAITEIVEPLLKKYAGNWDRVLEFASGQFPIREFLPNISEKDRESIELSDINKICVEFLMKNYPNAKCKELDIRSAKVEPGTQQYKLVITNDLMNTFSNGNLEKACQAVSDILEPGGFFINLTVDHTFPEYTFREYLDRKWVCLPWYDVHGTWVGICKIERQEFIEVINSLSSSETILQSILQKILELSPYSLNFLYMKLLKASSGRWLRALSNAIEKLNFQSQSNIHFEENFKSRLKSHLSKYFIVDECQEMHGSYVGKRIEKFHFENQNSNYFATFFNKQIVGNCCVLLPNSILEEAKVFAIICHKKL